MLKSWLFWKYLLRRTAGAYGIIDPLAFLARLQRFAEPAEVREPLELLRAGIIFHARGLINTRAIQHNLDWVWPYWVERQFDPRDVSFIPRSFSFSHVNLTHRNWTAVGLPDLPLYPIVDPRGLITPCHDSWSLDFWIVTAEGKTVLPSRLPAVRQQWTRDDNPAIMTVCEKGPLRLTSIVRVVMAGETPQLRLTVQGLSVGTGWLIVAVRPYNPEGVQFIERIDYEPAAPPRAARFVINEKTILHLSQPDRIRFSNYRAGDVFHKLHEEQTATSVTCETGMATSAALFPMAAGKIREIHCSMDLPLKRRKNQTPTAGRSWPAVLQDTAKLQVQDPSLQNLYNNAVRALIHLSAAGPVPGPYTYKRFWFRDACLMLNAVLALGLEERGLRLLNHFPAQQKRSGYYHSQNGEWDSNGQVLWLVNRFRQFTGRDTEGPLLESVLRGANWLKAKRASTTGRFAGLLPPGFSAEHFGPNDYYYWDDFWAVAGLRGAAQLAARYRPAARAELQAEADSLFEVITRNIEATEQNRPRGGIPASPNRRLDAGAIGSLVADYPLQLLAPAHPWTTATVDFIMAHCMLRGGFFQDIIHSGINAYLTLAIAQTMLRSGDNRYRQLIRAMVDLASPTGQWPEAIHPRTGGGCMGDGQHGWAAAEWIMMIRCLFVREEGDKLIIGSGLFPEWLAKDGIVAFGPTPTPHGPVRIEIKCGPGPKILHLHTNWRAAPPELLVLVPGYRARRSAPDRAEFHLESDQP